MAILFPSRKIKCLKIVILLSKNKLYGCVKYLSMFILTRLVFVFWDITETLMGVDLILIPIVTTKQESMYIFEKKICAQVFQNCVAVAMCNRVGSEGKMEFAGESLMTDAKGQVIVKADDSDFAKNKMKPPLQI